MYSAHNLQFGYSDGPLLGGCFRHRGQYSCNDGGPNSTGDEVAIGSAAAISKVAISNVHCIVESSK